MIKTTNLMVGDWIIAPISKYPIKITGINEQDITVYNEEDYTEYSYFITDIKPIPLTPEILEKNGWVLKEWSGHKQFQLTIEECGDEIIYKIDYEEPHFIVQCLRSSLELKYVHNLQHLLKECEIKKEIVL